MKRILSAIEIGGVEAVSSTLMQLSGSFSLYFHVPFCTKKCDYCHFYVIPDQQRFKNLYMQALKKEWEIRHHLLPAASPISIYFGGGTPALLGPKMIEEILSWISPSSPCEITLEVNPENVTLDLMQDFHRCGINRVSIGVQTLDAILLKSISRTHSVECSLSAVDKTMQAGISNISIDLMYDLPGQTLSSWKKTLDLAAALPITHLSLYNLTIEPHTVFFKKRKTLSLPDPEESLEMLQIAVTSLEASGLKRYEISAFAKEGMQSKHNTGYWTGRPFLGFGPSAFSDWDGSRFRNVCHLNRYAQCLEKGLDPQDFSETLPPLEKLKENLAVELRLIEGITLRSWPSEIETGLSQLEADGFLKKINGRLCLSQKGLIFHDTVAENIMNL